MDEQELINIIEDLQLKINLMKPVTLDRRKKYMGCKFKQTIKWDGDYYVDLHSAIRAMKRLKLIGQ